MSDYLGNLIARTISPTIAVRPHLPSLFEPAPAMREARSEPEFEQESFVEQSPVTPPIEEFVPIALPIPTPRHSVLCEDEQTIPEASRQTKIFETSHEPESASQPTLIRSQPTPQHSARVLFRRGDDKSGSERKAPARPQTFPPAASTSREDKSSNPTLRKSQVIKFPVRDVIESAPCETGARQETGTWEPAIASKPVVVPERREQEAPKQPGVQAIVPTIRSSPPIAPPPSVRSRLEKLTHTPKPREPVINVTIGRVEIRAVPPPAQQRAKPKPASVLSLEDYLSQRANGGRR